MKLKKILILVLVSILLNVCTIFAYQLIYEKMDKMLDKSGMKQEIIDSQTKPKTESKVSITSPSNNSILYTSTLTIQGTATGDNLEYVEVRRDTDTGQGTWTKATGTTLWQHAFLGCSNQTYTVKARAYSASGLSKETSINVTTSLATPGLSYTLINNEYAVGIGSITSGIIDIPNSYMGYPVTTITQQAFFGYGGILNGVTKINLPSSLRTIGSLAFGYCNGLKEIIVPNGVTNIDNWAFGMCSNLTNVVIPNSVLSVSYSLCYGNNNLRHITLSTNITWFDQRVLCYCILKELTLPPRLTYIGQYFNEYGNYEALVIPPLVSFIGTYAFAYNSSLTNVRFTGSIPPTADPDIFQSDTALSKIMVPSASLSAYKASLTQYSNKVFGY